jgi:hypothetical protein
MPTRTFRGTIDNDWHKAGNWLEGAVPVAGDDVVFDGSSPNCTLSANAPATGRLNSLICTNYTNTLNLNNYTISVGQGSLTGTILDVGANSKWGAGTIELYSTTSTATGVNVVQGRDNVEFSVINLRLNASSANRVIDIQSNLHIKDVIVIANYCGFANRNINIYVYGSLSEISGINTANIAINLGANNLYIIGGGGTIINLNNALFTYGSVVIQGAVTLSKNFGVHLNNTQNNNLVFEAGSYINCNGYDVCVFVNGSAFNHDINITNIDNLIINTTSNFAAYTRLLSDITINKKFTITETIRQRSPYNVVRGTTPGTKVNITLGNECKYMFLYANLQDISFNKPVKGFYCSYTNCDNIINGEYPEICVSVY